MKMIKKLLKRGDTLFSIARENNLSMEELLKLNPQIKNPDEIFTGDEINIGKQTMPVKDKQESLLSMFRKDKKDKKVEEKIKAYKLQEGEVILYDEDQGIRPVFPLLEILIGGPLRAAKIGKEVVQEVIEKRAMPKEVVHGSSEKGLKQIKSAAYRSPRPNEGIQAGIYTSKKGGVAELYAKNGQLYTVDTSYIPKNAMNVFNLGKDKVLNTNRVPPSFYKILDNEIVKTVPGRGKGSLTRFKENLVRGEGVTFVTPTIQDVLLKNNYKVINTNLAGGKNNNHYILLDNVVNVKGN
jgi:hypothetical protein